MTQEKSVGNLNLPMSSENLIWIIIVRVIFGKINIGDAVLNLTLFITY